MKPVHDFYGQRQKREARVKITRNPNKAIVGTMKEERKQTGCCPCRRERTEETKCMCREFRGQIADENFGGSCH